MAMISSHLVHPAYHTVEVFSLRVPNVVQACGSSMLGHRQQSGHELPGEARILGVEVLSWPSETENENLSLKMQGYQ